MLARLRSHDPDALWWIVLGALAAVAAGALVLSGPGNDLDVGNVFRSGRAIARHLDYVPSRPPGAPVHETAVGLGDLLGGPVVTNLLSLAAALAALVALERLLAAEGIGRAGRWAVALVAVNPWFLVAATSTADYVFALAFALAAALALRRDRAILAGLLAAAAMGSRIGTITILAGVVVAELGAGAERRRPLAVAGVTTVVGTALLFVPSVLDAGGLAFAANDFSASSPLVQLGRALAKDALLVGLPTLILILVAVPAIWAALRRWSTSWLVRFSVVGLVASQLVFLRFPWKMAHLLPTLLCLAILLAVALEHRPRLLMAMVAFQVLFAVVRIDVIQPDDPNQATGGRVGPGVAWGPVVQDLQCRRDDPDAYLGRQKPEIEDAWDCASPFAD